MNKLTFRQTPTHAGPPTVNLSMDYDEVKVTYHDGHEDEIDMYGLHWIIQK